MLFKRCYSKEYVIRVHGPAVYVKDGFTFTLA